jgi:hypothetical protein
MILMRDMTARYPRAIEAHSRIPALDAGAVERLLAAENAAGLEALAVERTRLLWLDDQFVKAGTSKALEPHARLALLATDVMWSMAQSADRVTKLLEWGASRHREIELEAADRYHYGWRGDPGRSREIGGGWKRAEDAIAAIKKLNPRHIPKILIMGGNGSSKSEYAAWKAVKLMVDKPGTQVACLCPSQTQARKVLMSRLFDNLPAEWRPAETGKAKNGITGNISYTRKMGFTENMFILPNASRCTFYFYLEGDPASIEGDQLDLVLADEEVPVEWLEACEYRLARTGGTLMAMFTPISGYIPAVSWFRGAARVVEQRAAPLLKRVNGQEIPAWLDGPHASPEPEPVMMPLLEHGADPTKRIVYFWTEDCPYPLHGYETLVELLKSKRASVNEIKTRAYGWPSKVRDARFPILDEKVHAIHPKAAKAGEIPKGSTWYHYLDPANARNHVMQWYAKTPDGREILAREWPQQDDYIPGVGRPGPWAEDAKKGKAMDGVPGPAQEAWGLTTEQYAAEIKRVEIELARDYEGATDGDPVKVYERIMDSRAAANMVHGRTYISEFDRFQIYFIDASGKALNARSDNPDGVCGVSLITDALGYDTQKPVGPSNRPRLMIVYAPPNADAGEETPHGCGNSWDSLKNWTGADGLKGARKDFIDLFHYAQRAEMRHMDMQRFQRRPQQEFGY